MISLPFGADLLLVLHCAASRDCVDTVKMLLARGADRHARTLGGKTVRQKRWCSNGPDHSQQALEIARAKGFTDVVALLNPIMIVSAEKELMSERRETARVTKDVEETVSIQQAAPLLPVDELRGAVVFELARIRSSEPIASIYECVAQWPISTLRGFLARCESCD